MLMTVQEVVAKINSGATLYLAADEQLLAQLPKGNWIGGTIPYFMDTDGGTFSQDKIFVQEQSAQITSTVIKSYGVDALPAIAGDSPDDGFSIVIIPGMSPAHARYAQEAPDYPGLFMKQIVGWIAGVDLADIGKVAPKVYNGVTGEALLDQAVVLHATLAPGKMAVVGIVNLFEQGSGDVLRFETDGFTVENCLVNGESKNFAKYLVDSEVDTLLPLVADYHGEMINVSLQRIDSDTGKVELYAPVFQGVEYRVAKPVTNYIEAFTARLPQNLAQPEFTCNCILNYLYSGLEGKRTGSLTGPVTFGEIAYQLLNQTLVYLQVRDV